MPENPAQISAMSTAEMSIENLRRSNRERVERQQASQPRLTREEWIRQVRLFEDAARADGKREPWWKRIFGWSR